MPLRDYQLIHWGVILHSLFKHKSVIDASETGTGKTYVALECCKMFQVTPLVIGPKNAKFTWSEASDIMEVPIEFINYERLRGTRKERDDGRRVTETDYIEEVPWGKGSFIKWKQSYEMIIFDEVHRCGGATSLNSKLLIAARRQAKYVMGLSATAADDPRQMKALGYALGLHGLSKRTRLQSDYMGWLFRHGVKPGVFGGFDFTEDKLKQTRAFDKLHREIFPEHGARMVKSLIPNFPETVIEIKLIEDETGRAAKLMDELHVLNGKGGLAMTEAIGIRQKLENLKVPYFVDMAVDAALTSKVVIFVNFTDPLFEIYNILRKKFGADQVGYISGAQTGVKGEEERRRFLTDFRADKLAALVCNNAAAGESANMQGLMERTTIISPGESGRQLKQVLGRVHRDGGARSQQFLVGFKDTYEEKVLRRTWQKLCNVETLNDGDLRI